MLPRAPVQGFAEIARVGRGSSAAVLVSLVAALISGCETSSTVSTGPNPVKCSVSLAGLPTVEATGGAGTLAVTTQPECTWDASTSAGWISALSPTSGQGTGSVSFRVAANEGNAAREGMIVVNNEQARVSQRAPCRFDVGPAAQSISAIGGRAAITIASAADCAWTATTDVTWLSLTAPAAGTGNGTVGFAVAANDGAQRTGSITVGTQRALVTQESSGGAPAPKPPSPPTPPSNPCTYSLSSSGDFTPANEGSGSVLVFALPTTCTWTAVSNAPWILVSSGATGTGNGSVTYRVVANTGGRRSSTLTIAGLTFTVTQGAASGQAPSAAR